MNALQEAERLHLHAAALRRMKACIRMVEKRPLDIVVLEPQDRAAVAQVLAVRNPLIYCRIPRPIVDSLVELDAPHFDLVLDVEESGWADA